MDGVSGGEGLGSDTSRIADFGVDGSVIFRFGIVGRLVEGTEEVLRCNGGRPDEYEDTIESSSSSDSSDSSAPEPGIQTLYPLPLECLRGLLFDLSSVRD